MADRFDAAIAAFDAANAEDPFDRELLYAERMSARLSAFAPDASEHLKLAARAQHLCRWRIARREYPMDRAGYRAWRTELGKLHARLAGELMAEVGYDPDAVARVRDLLRKKRLKVDPEAQTLEDVACLVFLEHYFADFSEKHDDAKLISILRKTWVKMSPAGQTAALELPLSDAARSLIEKALS